MTAIAYGTGAYRRDNGNLPELRLRNLFLESASTADEGVILLSRKGLTKYLTPGDGPVTGLFSQEGVFGGDVFSVSGGKLFRNLTPIGTIFGSGPVSFAAGSSDELAVCAGVHIYRYDGTGLATVSFPDSASVTSIEFHDGLYFAVRKDSNKWYWSNVLDADTWDPLNFASAEAKPDTLLDIKAVGDFLYLLGAETIEKWANTGAADIPYTRIEGAIIQKGVIGTGCASTVVGTLFLVSNDGVVYKIADTISRVSDNGIEERVLHSSSVSTFSFTHEGHSFFCIRLDTGSFLYDTTTGQWCEFSSYGKQNWQAACSCAKGSTAIFGDDTSGTLWTLDGWADGGQPMERLLTAAFPLKGGVVVIDNLTVEINTGWTTLLAGQGSVPTAELRSSVDGGATWSNWRSADIGQQGKYRVKTQWRRLGMFDFPGAMFEIRTTDPISFRVSSVVVNEMNGGRSR